MSLLRATTETSEYYSNWYHEIQFSRTLFSSGFSTGLLLPLTGKTVLSVFPSTLRFGAADGKPTPEQVEYSKWVMWG